MTHPNAALDGDAPLVEPLDSTNEHGLHKDHIFYLRNPGVGSRKPANTSKNCGHDGTLSLNAEQQAYDRAEHQWGTTEWWN